MTMCVKGKRESLHMLQFEKKRKKECKTRVIISFSSDLYFYFEISILISGGAWPWPCAPSLHPSVRPDVPASLVAPSPWSSSPHSAAGSSPRDAAPAQPHALVPPLPWRQPADKNSTHLREERTGHRITAIKIGFVDPQNLTEEPPKTVSELCPQSFLEATIRDPKSSFSIYDLRRGQPLKI